MLDPQAGFREDVPENLGFRQKHSFAPRKGRRVGLRLETDKYLAVCLQHWALDHRRLRQHERDGFLLGETFPVFLRKFSKSGAGPIEKHFPTHFAQPALQLRAIDALRLVVMKDVCDAMAVQPGSRLFHRVAILDAVEDDFFCHVCVVPERGWLRNLTILQQPSSQMYVGGFAEDAVDEHEVFDPPNDGIGWKR